MEEIYVVRDILGWKRKRKEEKENEREKGKEIRSV